jgi:hypothetical protein
MALEPIINQRPRSITRPLSRDVLAGFLGDNFEAIKTFENMQQAVTEVIISGEVDAIQLEAIVAGVQALTVADSLALLAEALGKEPLAGDTSLLEGRTKALELGPASSDLAGLWAAVEALQSAPVQPVPVPVRTIRTITVSESVQPGDYTVLGDATGGAVVLTLPPASAAYGMVLNVKKIDVSVNAVTVTADGSDLIDGAATYPLLLQYDAVSIQCDGAAWWVL